MRDGAAPRSRELTTEFPVRLGAGNALSTSIAASTDNIYLHSDGNTCTTSQSSGVTTRFLDSSAPNGIAKCKDSAAVTFANGNPFQQSESGR